MMDTFAALTNQRICERIREADAHVVLAAPGVSDDIARELVAFASTQERQLSVQVLLDPDPEVCRLGYGEIAAVERLMQAEVCVRKVPGIRIGVLVIDERAWIYSPTPLAIEAEPTGECPNAVAVSRAHADALLEALAPDLLRQASLFRSRPEVGTSVLQPDDVAQAKRDLEVRPPQQFDLARRVRVYTSFVQFVELSLNGCHLGRHTISIPPELLRLAGNQEERERLKATYQLIDEGSGLSGRRMEEMVAKLRKDHTRSLGKQYGTVILRENKDAFLADLQKAREALEAFALDVRSRLSSEFDRCREELLGILLPGVVRNPPGNLASGVPGRKPTEEQAKRYLLQALNQVVPKPDSFVRDMKLECAFKDVTYEMLNDTGFQDALRAAYPYVDWPQPFEETETLGTRD